MATWVVVANMIGTGIFSSLGFQLIGISDYFSIVMLWLAGGVISLCGAYVYSRLAVNMPDAVGEYHYLSRLVHPSVGFVSSWISITLGFAAPIALVMKAICAYLPQQLFGMSTEVWALLLLFGVTTVHATSYRASGRFHSVITIFKIGFLALFALLGFVLGGAHSTTFLPTSTSLSTMSSTAFAISLVYVLYTYSGWNASTYLARELPKPEYTLPRSMIIGTLLVASLYIALNIMFLYAAPASELRVADMSQPRDLAVVVARSILPGSFQGVIAGVVCLLFVSSMSSLILAGPRVTLAIAEQYQQLRILARRNASGIPVFAIVLQTLIAAILFVTNTFDATIKNTTMMLTLSSIITVASILKIEKRGRVLIAAGIFILANVWVLIHVALDYPPSLIWTALIMGIGMLVYRSLRTQQAI
jgi:APA family basic amino acid/polyamine antiporter